MLASLTAVVADELDPAPHAGPLRPVIEGLLDKNPAKRLGIRRTERMLLQAESAAGEPAATHALPAPESAAEVPPAGHDPHAERVPPAGYVPLEDHVLPSIDRIVETVSKTLLSPGGDPPVTPRMGGPVPPCPPGGPKAPGPRRAQEEL